MNRYPDFVERVMLSEGMLEKLLPKEIADRDLWRRVREASDATIAGGEIGNPVGFGLVRGGLLYALDDLDGAHKFSQDNSSDLGSYWHGMMHRREGDFDNARYWFRRSGRLPFFDSLHHAVAEFSADMARQLSWDPYLFTGQCEQHRFGADEQTKELVRLQRAEFDVVFEYTWRQAKTASV